MRTCGAALRPPIHTLSAVAVAGRLPGAADREDFVVQQQPCTLPFACRAEHCVADIALCVRAQVVDLVGFLDGVARCFPSLVRGWHALAVVLPLLTYTAHHGARRYVCVQTYLSFMRNPASPSMLCASEEDAAAMRRYRFVVEHQVVECGRWRG